MKSTVKEILFGVLVLLVHSSAGDDAEAIRTMCRLRAGSFAHPNPQLCDRFVVCALVDGVVQMCPENQIFFFSPERACLPGNSVTCQRQSGPQNPVHPEIPIFPNEPETTVVVEEPTTTPAAPETTEWPGQPTLPGLPTPPPIAPEVPIIPDDPNLDDICAKIEFGFLPDPRTCRAFILCIFFNPIFVPCSDSFPIFDGVSECVAGNPDTCEIGGTTVAPPQTPPNTPPPTIPETIPPGTDVPTLPPPVTDPPTIPPGTDVPTVQPPVTDPETIPPNTEVPTLPPPVTDPSTVVPTFPTVAPPTTTPPSGTDPPINWNICLSIHDRFVAHPTICYRYYYCWLGIPLANECPSDRIFYEGIFFTGCVLGNRQTCQRSRLF